MYQYALVKMLYNGITKKYHPIYYFDSPLPGGAEANKSIVRYKSKGHHTTGFDNREEAVRNANNIAAKLKEMGNSVSIELDESADLAWNTDEIPADVQLRMIPKVFFVTHIN